MNTSSQAAQFVQEALESGLLSQGGHDALNVIDVGAQITAALGAPAMETSATEVVLVEILIDDSGSIRMVQGNTEAVRDGHNALLGALKGSKQGDGVQVHCRYLNGKILYPFVTLDNAPEMNSGNYNPQGGTPLYDQTLVILATLVAKVTDFTNNGIPVRTVTVIVTDGADVHSQATAAQVAKVVKDLLKQENHIICGMGINDGSTDFKKVFAEMGIPPEWVLTPGNSPSEIRKAFAVVSKSAVRASQSAASFSKAAGGGFAA